MQEEEVIGRLPEGWRPLFHQLQQSPEVAQLWYLDATQSGYGHRPEWHTLFKSLQVHDPCVCDSQLVFKPRFTLLSMELQEKFLTFLTKESFMVPDRELLKFARAVGNFIGTDPDTLLGRQMALLCQQIQGYSDSEAKLHPPSSDTVEQEDAPERQLDTEITDLNRDSNEHEELIIIDEEEEEEEPAAKRQKLDTEGEGSPKKDLHDCSENIDHDMAEPNAEAEESLIDSNEGISEMIEKLKEILQSGEEEGFSELLSEVAKLSLRDIEWFCKRIDFCEMTDDSTEVVCKHMCQLAELLSYKCAMCLLQYVILDKVLQLSQAPSRKLSGAITLVAEKFPKQLVDSVLVPCIRQEDMSSFQGEVLCRIIKDEFTAHSRTYLVQNLFSNNLTISENKLPVMQTVFETTFDADESIVSSMLDSFELVSDSFAKNLKFGKLLLAVVSKHGTMLKGEIKMKFSSIVDKHGTFLKKSMKNALSKLK